LHWLLREMARHDWLFSRQDGGLTPVAASIGPGSVILLAMMMD
jgi:hypothetical protein